MLDFHTSEALWLEKASVMLKEVHGKTLPVAERTERAILLASLLLQASQEGLTASEKVRQDQLAGMVQDPFGKAFATSLTDQCFRSRNRFRV